MMRDKIKKKINQKIIQIAIKRIKIKLYEEKKTNKRTHVFFEKGKREEKRNEKKKVN
jgi:hypothetical protein